MVRTGATPSFASTGVSGDEALQKRCICQSADLQVRRTATPWGHPQPGTPTAGLTRKDRQGCTYCAIPAPCSVFKPCHAVIPPLPFHEGCVFDHCHNMELEVVCSGLELYALLCAAQGVCVDWRSWTNNSCCECLACLGTTWAGLWEEAAEEAEGLPRAKSSGFTGERQASRLGPVAWGAGCRESQAMEPGPRNGHRQLLEASVQMLGLSGWPGLGSPEVWPELAHWDPRLQPSPALRTKCTSPAARQTHPTATRVTTPAPCMYLGATPPAAGSSRPLGLLRGTGHPANPSFLQSPPQGLPHHRRLLLPWKPEAVQR